MAADIQATLEAAGIDLAEFVRPYASPHHVRMTQEFVQRLHADGHLVGQGDPLPLVRELRALPLRGLHPRPLPALRLDVGRQPVRGLRAAERLRRPAGPVCTTCGKPPARRAFTRLFFPVSRWEKELRGVPPQGGDEPQPALALRAGAGRRRARHGGDPRRPTGGSRCRSRGSTTSGSSSGARWPPATSPTPSDPRRARRRSWED